MSGGPAQDKPTSMRPFICSHPNASDCAAAASAPSNGHGVSVQIVIAHGFNMLELRGCSKEGSQACIHASVSRRDQS